MTNKSDSDIIRACDFPLGQVKDKICFFDKGESNTLLQKLPVGSRTILTNGCFDLLHYGHIFYLSEASKAGDFFIVCVNSDDSVKKIKGPHRPIDDIRSRLFRIASLSFVDLVIVFDSDTCIDLVDLVRPDVYVKGGDYDLDQVPEVPVVQKYGGHVQMLSVIKDLSTSHVESSVWETKPEPKTNPYARLLMVGGLGDFLCRIFSTSDIYQQISESQAPVDVLLFSSDSYAQELFENHPNKDNIHLHTFDRYPQFQKGFFTLPAGAFEQKDALKKSWMEHHLDEQQPLLQEKDINHPEDQRFYPFEEDVPKLAELRKNPYCVVQAFSAGKQKDIPHEILRDIVSSALEKSVDVILPIRDNVRTRQTFKPNNATDDLRQILGDELFDQVTLVELSTPGVIELIRTCDFFVGSDSAFVKVAWGFRKNNIFLMPPHLLDRPANAKAIREKTGNYFGIELPETYMAKFDEFSLEKAKEKMSA